MDATQTKALLNRVRRLDIRTRRLMNDSLLGEYHSVFKGRGMDFDEVREYVAGDEVRTIDWNVTARTGHPFVKKYTEERELTLLLVIDISESGNFGGGSQSKRELAAEVASLLALSAIRNGDRVGLLLFSDRIEQYIEPKKGRRHVLRVVREILFHEAEGRGTDVLKALDVAGHVLHRRAIVFLISDFQSNDDTAKARPRCAGRCARRIAAMIWSRCTSRMLASANCPTWAWCPWRTRRPANWLSWIRPIRWCGNASVSRPRHTPRNCSATCGARASMPCS